VRCAEKDTGADVEMNPNLRKLAEETKGAELSSDDTLEEVLLLPTTSGLYALREETWMNIRPRQPHANFVMNILIHESDLYAAFVDGLRNLHTKALITDREMEQVCSFNGEIYDSGDYGLMKTISNEIIDPKAVNYLCVHNNQILYELEGRPEIFTYPDTGIYKTPRRAARTLFISHNNKLHVIREDNFKEVIYDEDDNEVGRLPDDIGGMHSFAFCNGSLFILGVKAVYDVAKDKTYHLLGQVGSVFDLYPVPLVLAKKAGILK
jgi:hypothetical protein